MTRTITAGMITEITAASLRPFTLLKFAFDSGDLNLWNGVGDLSWSGDTYTGAGNLLAVSVITETEAIVANSVTFTLSGMPASIISTALSEDYQGRPVSVWRGAFDASKSIIADPILIFSGNMDVMRIEESGGTTSVSVIAESQLRALTRPSPRKWTSMDQKVAFPADKGFDELPQIQDDSLIWFA